MLIKLTVQSEGYKAIVSKENGRVIGTTKDMLFETEYMQNVDTNRDNNLPGTSVFIHNKKYYGVLESLDTILSQTNGGVVKYSESASNVVLVEDTLKSIAFDSTIGESSDDFTLTVSCRDDSGNVDYVVENITSTGFDITASADCMLSYVVTVI